MRTIAPAWNRTILALLAALTMLVRTQAADAQQRLVQPESLEQGYVIVVEDKARVATTEAPILLASNHNGWNPNDPTQALSRRSDGRWQIVREKPSLDSRLSFKFTRGSWETVEVDENLQEIENRLLPLVDASKLGPGERPVIELVIHNWKDQRPPEPDIHRTQPHRQLEVTGNVRRMEVVLLGQARDVLVWLPPGYENAPSSTYPVVYMLDGQSAFEHVPAIGGEWDADAIAARLCESGRVTPPIIVAVPGQVEPAQRNAEYGLDAYGPRLIDDLANQLAPRLARAVRADHSRAMIVGAGKAGELARAAAERRPDIFGQAFVPHGMSRPETEGVPFDPSWPEQLEEALSTFLAAGRPSGIAQPGVMKEPELLPAGFVLVVTDKSGKASQDRPMFVASNHNGWNPGDATKRLTPRSDGKWQIELPPSPDGSRMAFKLTLGAWETVEVDASMNDISNRTLPLVDAASIQVGSKPVIEITAEQFRDPQPWENVRLKADPNREIPVAGGTLRRLEVVGGGVDVRRDLLVWLPPGYDEPENAERAYPVLYLHDGQNVFEKLPNVPGEWRADETAIRLIEAGEIEPLIIVGVPSVGMRRIEEYLPVELFDGVPARGKAHVDWLVNEVMPRVQRAVRVRPGKADVVVGGSSLGAVISLYAASEYPDVIGAVLLESPAMLSKDRLLMRYFAERSEFPLRVYIGVGGKEVGNDPSDAARNRAYEQCARDLLDLLGRKGIAEGDRILLVSPDAHHNEDAWAERLPEAMKFLFPPMVTGN